MGKRVECAGLGHHFNLNSVPMPTQDAGLTTISHQQQNRSAAAAQMACQTCTDTRCARLCLCVCWGGGGVHTRVRARLRGAYVRALMNHRRDHLEGREQYGLTASSSGFRCRLSTNRRRVRTNRRRVRTILPPISQAVRDKEYTKDRPRSRRPAPRNQGNP